jgi:hypothetical protein
VRSAKELALLSGGERVPVQWREAVRWPDGSLRWVCLDLVTDLGAGQRRAFDLVKVADGGNAAGDDLAREAGSHIEVVTGPLKFRVRKESFNLVDEAWIDGSGGGRFDDAHRVIAPHREGCLLTSGGRVHRSAADPRPRVVIEENGPVKCQIRATGEHRRADGKMTDFMVRLTAYRGCPAIRVQFAWVCRQGTNDDVFTADDISLELPTLLAGKLTWQLGGEKDPHAGRLAAGEQVYAHQKSIDEYAIGGAGPEEKLVEAGEKTDVFTTGWGSIDDGRLGIAVGRRWFWQTYPADVTLSCAPRGSTVRLGLWSRLSGKKVRLYNGAARTSEAMIHFFPAAERGAVAARMLDCTRPLRALAPPAWYCSRTLCLGPLAESDARLFAPEVWEAVQAHDRVLDGMIGWVNAKRRSYRGGVESYGYRYFGDFVHWKHEGGGPHSVQWDCNYYDYPHANFAQFLRTGDRRFLRMFEECEQVMADIHVVHWYNLDWKIGSCRYCPSWDQACMEDAPRVMGNFRHHKVRSIVEKYLLAGDRWAEDVARLVVKQALENHRADDLYSGPRSPGHQLTMLWAGHMLAAGAEKGYMDHARTIVDNGIKSQKKHGGLYFLRAARPGSGFFQLGLTMEGFLFYFLETGDERAVGSVKDNADAMMARCWKDGRYDSGGRENTAFAYAFLWRWTGNPEYRKVALWLLANAERKDKVKDYGMAYRSTAYAVYYLSKLADEDPLFKDRRKQ